MSQLKYGKCYSQKADVMWFLNLIIARSHFWQLWLTPTICHFECLSDIKCEKLHAIFWPFTSNNLICNENCFQSYLTKRYPSTLKANHCPLKQSRLPVAEKTISERRTTYPQQTCKNIPEWANMNQHQSPSRPTVFYQHLQLFLVYITSVPIFV